MRGEIVERPLPNKTHSKIQGRLYALLIGLGFCYPALRMRLADGSYRIPDIAFFEREPDGEVRIRLRFWLSRLYRRTTAITI